MLIVSLGWKSASTVRPFPRMDFPDTRWTLISHLADPVRVNAALDTLCRMYQEPIHTYLLQFGHSHVEAQDLTQDFLGMVVRQRLLERADPVEGRLRSWLLAALHRFVASTRRYESRLKRGANVSVLPLDHEDVTPELARLAAPSLTPEEAFDRAWIAALLRRVLDILAQQYRQVGRETDFQALMPSLLENRSAPQPEAAARAGMTVANFRVQLHRLRARYRDILRQEIILTLEDENDYPAELEHLFRVAGLQT